MNAPSSDATVLRIVLLGASGFVGRAVLRRLAQLPEKKELHALVHRSPLEMTHDFVTSHQGSMTELPLSLFPDAPHVVIHCASKQIDHDGSGFAENLQGIDALAQAINSHTRAILYASSYSVYGDGPQIGIDESAELCPQSPLARSRAACEARLAQLAAQRGIAAISFRTRFITGVEDAFFLPGLIKLMRTGVQIDDETQRYSIIDVDDYAQLMLDVGRDVLTGARHDPAFVAYNVGYEQPITLADIRAILQEITPAKKPHLRLPVREGWLRLLEAVPSMTMRQLAQRLRLLGYDHYGLVRKLASSLRSDILRTDPKLVLRRAALALR